MRKLRLLLVAALALAGCAEMSGAQRGALIGAGTGAAAGAIIGNQVPGNRPGHAGMGAAIGALGGAAAGALIGDALQPKQPVPAAPQGGQLQPVPPPGQAGVTVPGQYPADPTRGQLANGTPFRVEVYIDSDPTRGASPTMALNPREALPVNLDVGPHRIVALATRDTQFGPRPVGRLDRELLVNVRGSGWELRFSEGDFR